MWRWAVLVWLGMVAGCASVPASAPPDPTLLFDDRAFAPASERISADDVFALSEPMRRYIDTHIARESALKGRQHGLIDALYKKGQLKLDYDATLTRNAAQAFEGRSGNCLSLVIMTAAFAKEVGLPVRFNSVYVDETWSRDGNLFLANGHVNVSLGRPLGERAALDLASFLTVDFLAPRDLRGYRSREITEQTIVAMFMNNRAVENLARSRTDDAYWWARAAIEQQPTYLAAYNTLGVIYLRRGKPVHAERVLRHVLASEPANTSAIANLIGVLDALGRGDEARVLSERLASIEQHPPYHYFDRGVAAMKEGDFRAAKSLFEQEIARAAHHHEFHFWLALANMGLRDVGQARRHLKLAIENSTTQRDHALYTAKLDLLVERRRQ